MASACHVCVRTGERTCDEEEAELKCMICGYCEHNKTEEEDRDGE